MARIVPTLDFVTLLPTKTSLSNFLQMLRKVYTNLALTLNGKVGFGDGTNFDNISGTWANTTAPAAPNTDFTITHNLGRVPVGYWVMQKDRACDVYTGSVAATATQLTLRATVASAVLRLFIVCFLLFFASVAQAQTTTVTLQVTDLGGQAWNLGTWSVVLVSKQGAVPFGPPFNIPGSGPVPNQFQTGTFDATGTATVIVTPNASIVPTQSQWRFTVCPQATSPCFDQASVIAGATQSVSPVPPAISVSCGAATKAYSDSEVLCQQGGFYYRLPTNTLRLCTVSVLPNTCTTWIDTGQGAAAAAGSPPQTQVNDPGNPGHFGGTPCENFPSLTVGPINADCDWHSKGPNPYLDVTRFGVRAINNSLVPTSTGNCSSGSPTITLTGGASTFINGDGVVMYGCGSGTITAPSAPTVTPSVAAGQTGSLLDANGLTGATTYCYQILATTFTGATNISPEVCTSTGPTSLGPQSVSISSVTLANNVATYTTSSAHGLVPGAFVVITGVTLPTADVVQFSNPFNCWCSVSTTPDSTHFTVNVLADTRNGALSAATVNTGTVNWWNDIRIQAADLTGNYQYWVYGRVSGGTKTLLGPIWPQNSTFAGDHTYQVFDDFGSTLTTYTGPPLYVPTTVPSSPTNDALISKISSGAGTTTLTLANNAGNTSSGVTVTYDDMVNFLTAANAAVNQAGGTAGAVMLPETGIVGSYHFNSPATFPVGLSVHQKGSVQWNAPVKMNQTSWVGENTSLNGQPGFSFSIGNPSIIFSAKCSPCIYVTASSSFAGVNWSQFAPNGTLIFIQDSGGIPAAGSFENVTIGVASTQNPYMSMGLVFRGGSGWYFKKVALTSSQNPSAFSTTPGIYFDGNNNATFDDLNLSGIGVLIRPNLSGAFLAVGKTYSQGNYMPFFSFVGDIPQTGGQCFVKLGISVFDTTTVPLIASYGTAVPPVFVDTDNTLASSTDTVLTGNAAGIFLVSRNPAPAIFPNTNATILNQRLIANSSITDGFSGFDIFNESMMLGQGYSFYTATGPNAAPTCVVSAGGSVPTGTLFYYYAPIYPNGSEGAWSAFCTVTTTTGNQTVTLTVPSAVAGVTQYAWYRGPAQRNISRLNSLPTTGLTLVDTSAGTAGNSPSNLQSGGPAGIQGTKAWAQTTQTGLSLATSAATANRNVSYPDNSGMVPVTSYLNTGYEDCNRADGAVGSNWTSALNSFNCLTNQIKGNGGVDNTMFWSALTTPATGMAQFSQATMSTLGSRSGPGVYINASSGYVCVENTTALSIYNLNAGALQSQLATVAITGNNGDLVRLEINPTVNPNLNCFVNGVSTLTTNNTGVTSGAPGLNIFSTSVRVDNWSGGNLHPIAQLDAEQDWTQPQHFTQPVTIGATNPIAGTLTGALYGSQLSNGSDTITFKRNTDTAPSGTFLRFTQAGGTDVFNVNVGGLTQIAGNVQPTAASIGVNTLGTSTAGWSQIFLGGATPTQLLTNATALRTVTFPDATGTVALGVLQSVNSTTTTCPTGAAAGSTCTFTVTWGTAFADTTYTPSCIGGGTITGFPFIQGFSSKTTTALTVVVVNGTSNEAVASGYSEMDCIARHP